MFFKLGKLTTIINGNFRQTFSSSHISKSVQTLPSPHKNISSKKRFFIFTNFRRQFNFKIQRRIYKYIYIFLPVVFGNFLSNICNALINPLYQENRFFWCYMISNKHFQLKNWNFAWNYNRKMLILMLVLIVLMLYVF